MKFIIAIAKNPGYQLTTPFPLFTSQKKLINPTHCLFPIFKIVEMRLTSFNKG